MSVALPMLLMGGGAPWQWIAVAAVAPGVLQAVYYVLWTTTLQERFAPEVLVRVNSWNMVTSYALMPLIMLASGPLAAVFGPEKLAFWSGIIAIIATLSTLAALRLTPKKESPADVEVQEAIT
jgi:MFS family permease